MPAKLERLNWILEQTGKLDGIGGLRLGDAGTAGLDLDSGVRIFFEYADASERLFIYTPLLEIPPDPGRRLPILDAMLHCNFRELHAGQGVLALFRHTGQAVYQIDLDAVTVDVAQVDQAIETLLARRDDLLYQLERPAVQAAEPQRARPMLHPGLKHLAGRKMAS